MMEQIGRKKDKIALDSMQQHSGEHIMSAILKRDYGVNILSFHMGERVNYIDINRCDLTETDFLCVENLVNNYITENHIVTVQIYQKEDLPNLPLRKMPTKEFPYYRVVSIGDLDCCLCAGDHVDFTSKIGIFKITDWERKKNNFRVYFICGNRALADYQDKTNFIKKIVQDLSLDSNNLFVAWEKHLAKERQRDEELKKTKLQLNSLLVANLLKTAGDKECAVAKFENYDTQALNELARTVLQLCERKIILLLLGQETEKVNILISANKDIKARGILQKYLTKYNGKGGGNERVAQGSITMKIDVDKLLEELTNDCLG